MYIRDKSRYNKPINIINAGEFHVSKNDEIISTLLGSCVAVCLYDPEKKIAGMNHFMLPGRISKVDIFKDRSAKYGITAIERLIAEMEKLGADRDRLVAKVFGGGSMFEYDQKTNRIPHDNIRLAKLMLEIEDIPIRQIDVGERFTRKIMMDVKSGKVYLKKTTNQNLMERVRKDEEQYVMKSLNN